MSSSPQNPEQTVPTPAAEPTAPAAPSAPVPHIRTSLQLDAETLAAIDAAMKTAVSEPAPKRPGPEKAPLHPDRARVPRLGSADRPVTAGQIRGPRVVQAGREQRAGAVVSVGPTDIFVEFGPKELGVVPRLQWPDDQLPKVGETVEVVVDHRDSDGLLNCSRPGLIKKADWEMLEPGQVIEARVSAVNKGGLELEVAGHSAFMPASQVALEHIADLSVFVGEKLKCKVTRVDRVGRGNIVLSRREILDEERKAQGAKLKESLAEGQTVEGTVRKVMPFGAFVDLGGVDGLIHVSDLTHDRMGHGEKFVEKYAKAGDKVRVQILKLDWAAGRISLGLKQTQADPFAVAASDIKDGAELTGRVTKLMEFGAFIELAPGVEGLVHISELAWRRVGKVEDVLKADEVVKVKVLKVDPQNRRVSLSIKALTPPPEAPAARPGGPGGRGGRRDRDQGRPIEEITKVTPELRRLREKFHAKQLKGGIA